MAKQRVVNTKFWSDSWVRELSPLHRYLFLYYITNERTNIAGIYELPVSIAAFETGIDPTEIEKKMLPRLKPKIEYHDGWIIIPNFIRHQNLSNPKVIRGIERELENVPESIMKHSLSIGYRYGIDRASPTKPNSNPTKLNNNLTPKGGVGGGQKKEKTAQKDSKEKKQGVELPDWLDKKKWQEWINYRKERRITCTDTTLRLQIAFLAKFKSEHVEILDLSMKNGWQGLFEPKRGFPSKPQNVRNAQGSEVADKLSGKMK